MKNSIQYALFIFSCALFWGCEKNSTNLAAPSTPEQTNQALHTLAQLLIQDQKTDAVLHKKQLMLNAKTGDQEFMLVDMKETGASQRTLDVIDQLLDQNPLMEIGYPSFAFQTAESFEQHLNSIQYYVVLDEETDPDSVSTLPAYDSEGNAVQISATFDENIRYAVIRIDEAHDAVRTGDVLTVKGNAIPASLNTFTPSLVNGNVKYYEEATILNAEAKDRGPVFGGSVKYRGDAADGECDRPANYKDQLYKIRFSDKSAVKVIESGFHMPNVELFFTYVFATVNAATSTYVIDIVNTQVDKNWSLMNGPDWTSVDVIGQQLRIWGGNDSDRWKVGIVEKDTNNELTSTWKFGVTPKYTVDKKWSFESPISYEIKKNKKDRLAGEVILEYCDDAIGEGTAYKVYTGGNDGMYFRENFKVN